MTTFLNSKVWMFFSQYLRRDSFKKLKDLGFIRLSKLDINKIHVGITKSYLSF